MDLRVVGIAERLGGAAAPIGDAGDGDRRPGNLSSPLEPLCCSASVAEETQRDPACMEVGVDLVGGIVRSEHVVAKFEREERLVEIEQFPATFRRWLHQRSELIKAARSCSASSSSTAAS